MKNERLNLNKMIIALKFVVNCDTLGGGKISKKKMIWTCFL